MKPQTVARELAPDRSVERGIWTVVGYLPNLAQILFNISL